MKKYLYYYITTLVFFFTACEREQCTENVSGDSMPIRICAVFNEEPEATTRAGIAWFNAFPGNTIANFYIYDDTNKQYIPNTTTDSSPLQMYALNQGSNILYPTTEYVQFMGFAKGTLSGNVITYSYETYPVGCETVTIHGFYPTTVNYLTNSFSVAADQTSNADYQSGDLLFAERINEPRSAYPIDLEFKHQMAKIIVNLLGSEKNNIKEIALQNVYRTINITPRTCQLGSLSGTKESVIMSQSETAIPTSVAALIPPQSVGGSEYFLKATTSTGKIVYFRSLAGNHFKSGKVYTFNLTINSGDFSSSSICYKDLNTTGAISSTPAAFFNYTGVEQQFVIPQTGNYKLEVWGAQGGMSGQVASGVRTFGGKGGYSQAIYTLTEGTVLYVVVGGAGVEIDADGVPALGGGGGYNGGGDGGDGINGCCGGGGGGGATHIALRKGLLETLSDNRQDVLIVAGGGGGASWVYYNGNPQTGAGGYGGGNVAGTGEWSNNYYSYKIKAPAGSSGGAGLENNSYYGYRFGRGQNGRSGINGSHGCEGNGGGGGGWYGGYSYCPGYYEIISYTAEPADSLCRWVTDKKENLTSQQLLKLETYSQVGGIMYKNAAGEGSDTAGGGGIGYINQTINTSAAKYVSSEIKAGNQDFYSPSGEIVTGHSGNGVARITKL